MQTGNIIVTPTAGTICSVSIDKFDKIHVRIFLSDTDDHTIYCPITGKITDWGFEEGEWNRLVFKAFEKKNARLHVEIENMVTFWVEVGYPKYAITDKLRFDSKKGDIIRAGSPIGEILFGSLSEIQIPSKYFEIIQPLVQIEEKLVGGQSPLAYKKNIGHQIWKEEYKQIEEFLKGIREIPKDKKGRLKRNVVDNNALLKLQSFIDPYPAGNNPKYNPFLNAEKKGQSSLEEEEKKPKRRKKE